MEAQQDRRLERPSLRAESVHLADPDTDLLVDLARDRFLQAFAVLDEAGERRVHARPEIVRAPEQAHVPLHHQHDDGRVGTREMLRAAGTVGAGPLVPGMGYLGRAAADAAEAVLAVPVHPSPRVGENGTLGARGIRPALTQNTAGTGPADLRVLVGGADGGE